MAPLTVVTGGSRGIGAAPGVTWTGFHLDPERPAKTASTIPFGRSGRPEEIASAAAWLLSPDASYVSGTILRVAGGM
jgi:NAD(P)-dependent dehydrogenase (short-subunit alcohol dehydrogenase family)